MRWWLLGAISRGCGWCNAERCLTPGATRLGLETIRLAGKPFDEMAYLVTRQQGLPAGKLISQLTLAVEAVNMPVAGMAES